jgi:hypothetical protein
VLADLKNLGNPIKPGVVYDYQYAIMKSSSQKRGVAQPSKQNSPSLKTRSPSSHGIVGVASGELRKLVVQLDSAPLKGMLPLVMLVSEGPARPAMIRPLRRTSPTATPSTRFTSVDPGKYLLAVEPLPHRQN